jgi:glycosyltransferase involved in cell wall biosynthesis
MTALGFDSTGDRGVFGKTVRAALIIPALNEERSIGQVLAEIPAGIFGQVLVVDNGSTDQTATVARSHGAVVLQEPRRGYGNACLRGMAHLDPETEVVVFLDADGSDFPAEAPQLIRPIAEGQADLVVGSRELGSREPGALNIHQRMGNRLAVWLTQALYGFRYTDLGPFRAIRLSSLKQLEMADRNYGWTIEMQVKALRKGLRVLEVPVSSRRRLAGASKVSGTFAGSIAAGFKILWTIARWGFREA